VTCSVQSVLTDGLAAGLMPDALLTCSEWADLHRQLDSRGSPEPGQWRTRRVPYAREIMDSLSISSPVQETAVMKGAQLGLTELANNFVGYTIDHAPGPGLFLQPSMDIANRNVRQKINPMILATPALAAKVPAPRSKEGGNTMEEKEFPGGIWMFKWASSTAGLRSSSIRFLILDEIDEYAQEVGEQGDPEMLARARTNAFGKRKKIFIPSTPTVEGRSRIANLFEESDQRRYYMPCPHCDKPILYQFKHLRWEPGQPDTVRYTCQECEKPIDEWQKTRMLEEADDRNLAGDKRYGWVPERPEITHRRGYHISSLYSPVGFKSWAEIAQEWDDAQGNSQKLKAFVNTVLGETWKDRGDAPEWQRLLNRCEGYPRNVVPAGGLVLVCGIDVQKTWIELTIWAYGRNLERWVVDHRQYQCPEGTTTADEQHPESPWRKLDELMAESWPHEHAGVCMQLSRVAIDASYETQTVYRWAAKHGMARVMPVMGHPTLPMICGTGRPVQVKSDGSKAPRGVKKFDVGLGVVKSELYAHLKAEPPVEDQPMPTGFIHFPQLDGEFFRQLCGEEQRSRMLRGRLVYLWEAIRLRVEVLDTAVYARAAAYMVGVDRFTEEHWRSLETSLGIGLDDIDSSGAYHEQNANDNEPPRRRSKFWGDRR
jgi:phage terminase large subunit GpA-like protein